MTLRRSEACGAKSGRRPSRNGCVEADIRILLKPNNNLFSELIAWVSDNLHRICISHFESCAGKHNIARLHSPFLKSTSKKATKAKKECGRNQSTKKHEARRAAMKVLRAYLCVLGLVFLVGATAHADDEGIHATQVSLDFSHVNVGGNVSAFIPTGSDSGTCLATPNDSNAYNVGPSPAICIPRVYEGQKGVVIIMIPYFAAFPTNLVLLVTVYQHGAKFYGTPTLYPY
jgi:hypothetical protein